jgi:CRP-like cAMP-binding protein
MCGETIIKEKAEQNMLYALEYGTCSVDIEGHGRVNTLTMGSCFGERTLMGHANTASATIRALSPYVILLVVPQEALNVALDRYQGPEKEHFDEMKRELPQNQQRGGQVQHIELFRPCSAGFCDTLSLHINLLCYMPGQTIVVQGAADAPNMFAIMGGTVAVERIGYPVVEMHTGATFGELLMLDLAQLRSCTVRAVTFCVLSKIPRAGFLEALKANPCDLQNFKGLNERKEVVNWPCLSTAPDRLQYLLDLYAEQRMTQSHNEIWKVTSAALLVVVGEVTVVDEDGNEFETLQVGQCRDFNYMLDLPDGDPVSLYKAQDGAKAKLVTKEIWTKVLAEFPAEEDKCKDLIQEFAVRTAQEKLGFTPGSTEVLRLSAIFRALSLPLVEKMASVLESRLCTPGSYIVKAEQQDEHGTYIVIGGHVSASDCSGRHLSNIGRVFGEEVMLGIFGHYGYSVEAMSLCTVQFLSKEKFQDVIIQSRDDYRIVSFLERESRKHGTDVKRLKEALQCCPSFEQCDPEFIDILSAEMEAVFFAPNDVIFKYGEECIFGESPCYLLVAGQVNIESKLGVRLGSVRAIGVFGEGVMANRTEDRSGKRSATVLAWEVGLVYCARIPGAAMKKAFERFPDEGEALVELFQARQASNVDTERNRRKWLKEVAMPSLADQPMFKMCAPEFLWALATPLHETEYKKGEMIVQVGEAAHSMFIILKGDVALESKTGSRISTVTAKASFGEVAMMGLLPTRTATLRALSPEVCVLEVTSLALQHALSTKYAGKSGDRFRQWVRVRQDQVSMGRPLSCLNINTDPNDISIGIIGLHAQRVCFKMGHVWQPMRDDAPYGPRYSIISHGRAVLEMSQTRRKVMTFVPSSLIVEGIAADFGAVMRSITTPCEVYQIFINDFKIATSTVSATTPWIWRFKVVEKEAKREMTERLENMHGLNEGLASHPRDEEIHAWRSRRDESMRLARQRRGIEDDTNDDKLPCIASIESRTSASESQLPEQSTWSKAGSDRERRIKYGTGLSSYPSFHLPFIQRDPAFAKSGRPLPRSQSEMNLRALRN